MSFVKRGDAEKVMTVIVTGEAKEQAEAETEKVLKEKTEKDVTAKALPN